MGPLNMQLTSETQGELKLIVSRSQTDLKQFTEALDQVMPLKFLSMLDQR